MDKTDKEGLSANYLLLQVYLQLIALVTSYLSQYPLWPFCFYIVLYFQTVESWARHYAIKGLAAMLLLSLAGLSLFWIDLTHLFSYYILNYDPFLNIFYPLNSMLGVSVDFAYGGSFFLIGHFYVIGLFIMLLFMDRRNTAEAEREREREIGILERL
jgi:hypothetical protein